MKPTRRSDGDSRVALPSDSVLAIEVVLKVRPRDSAWDELWRKVFSDMRIADLIDHRVTPGNPQEAA